MFGFMTIMLITMGICTIFAGIKWRHQNSSSDFIELHNAEEASTTGGGGGDEGTLFSSG